MGIIETKVKDAFEKFNETNDKFALVRDIAHVADYSVRSKTHWTILLNAIKKVKEEETNEQAGISNVQQHID